jgi:hypothetical protein
MDIVGPVGLRSFWDSTSHFMRLNESYLTIRECSQVFTSKYSDVEVLAIPVPNFNAVCYVIRTPTLPGKFDLSRAVELKVPKGPMYAKLKGGESVTIADGSVVLPEQVLGAPFLGRNVAIICDEGDCSNSFMASLKTAYDWKSECFDCVVHLACSLRTQTDEYRSWQTEAFTDNCSHVFVGKGNCAPDTSFVAATKLTNRLHDAVPELFYSLRTSESDPTHAGSFSDLRNKLYSGNPRHKYILLPANLNGLTECSLEECLVEDPFAVTSEGKIVLFSSSPDVNDANYF